MPDNQLPGTLENFVGYLVPEGDALWPHAINTVDSLPERRFNELHTAKVNIYTYLAWQAKPGRPMGQAITAKYLAAESQHAANFIAWIQRLFG